LYICRILFELMRIISKRKLMECWEKHPDSKRSLTSWYSVAKKENWKNVNQILSNSRIVFNIKGNNYRLITEAKFNLGLLYLCWVGTHADYNKIDAGTVWDE
jgi:mRNA interferase HigB